MSEGGERGDAARAGSSARPGPPDPGGRTPVAPTRDDPFARWASPLLGGPAGGRRAVPGHPWWSAARVLVLVAAATTLLSWLRTQHCRTQGWTTPGQFVHACYSDVAVLHGTLDGRARSMLGLVEGSGDGLGHPALTGYVGAGLALLTTPVEALAAVVAPAAEGVDAGPRVFFDLFAVVAALALVVTVLAVVSLSGRRPWDATLVALSPVVVLSGLVSFDLLGVALGVAGVAVWARGHPVQAGVLLGMAVAARFHVVLVLLALLLLAVRCAAVREATVTLVSAVVAWVTLNAPLVAEAPGAWAAPWRGWWTAEPGYGSLLLLPRLLAAEQVAGVRGLTALEATVVSSVLTLVVLVGVTLWVLACPLPPRLPVVVLLLLVGTLLVAKTVPVQASLWLLPWAALAVPGWRDHLWWWAAEALYVVAVWQHLVGLTQSDRALPAGFYAALLVGRLAAIGWLGRQAWQAGRHPDLDVVRLAADGHDPAAGLLRPDLPADDEPGPGGPGPGPGRADGPGTRAGRAPDDDRAVLPTR